MKPEVTGRLDALPERVDLIERKLDALSVSIDRRFEQVDQRFEQVDQRFEQVDQRFEQVDQRFEQVDQRFEQVDRRFDEVDERFAEQRQYTEFAYDRLRQEMTTGVARLERAILAGADRLGRLESKLDQLIANYASRSRRPSVRQPKKR